MRSELPLLHRGPWITNNAFYTYLIEHRYIDPDLCCWFFQAFRNFIFIHCFPPLPCYLQSSPGPLNGGSNPFSVLLCGICWPIIGGWLDTLVIIRNWWMGTEDTCMASDKSYTSGWEAVNSGDGAVHLCFITAFSTAAFPPPQLPLGLCRNTDQAYPPWVAMGDSATEAEYFLGQHSPHQKHWMSFLVVVLVDNTHVVQRRVCVIQSSGSLRKTPLWG